LNFGLASYQAIEKPLLKDVNRQNRYNWCQDRKYWRHEKWSTVIFSDGSNFELVNRKNSPLVRRFKHEKNFIRNLSSIKLKVVVDQLEFGVVFRVLALAVVSSKETV
jgi:hypothetical protein